MAEAIGIVGEGERAALVLFLRSIVRPGDDPEDVAQEALLRAYAARERFDERRSVGAWLRAIASNVAVDLLRRRGRLRFLSIEAAAHEPAAPDPAATASRALREERLLGALRAALGDLPEPERRAFCLFYEEGRSVEGIAGILGAPKGTVKSWLHRARERLRVRLSGLVEREEA